MKLSGSLCCTRRGLPALMLLISLCTLAQGSSPPVHVWSSMVFSGKGIRGIKTEWEHQLRSRFETPIFKETFYELRLSYPLKASFDITLFYRQIFYADHTAWQLAVAPQLKAPFGLDGLKLRLKLQRHASHGEAAKHHARFRGTFALPLRDRPCSFFVQAEPWWALEQPAKLSRYRLDAGFQRTRSGAFGYEAYYRLQGDQSGNSWQETNILGLKLQATL